MATIHRPFKYVPAPMADISEQAVSAKVTVLPVPKAGGGEARLLHDAAAPAAARPPARTSPTASSSSPRCPALIAAHAAMFDHLAKGRFIFGISPGALASDAEALGIYDEDRNKLFGEAIDVILAIWERDPPYDIDFPGNRFKVSTARSYLAEFGRGIMYKPYQKPRPEIVGTVVAPHSQGVIAMGERDFHPLSANFLLPHWLPSHWANYAEGKRRAGLRASCADWRIARTIFVADDQRTAESYGREDARSPYRFYWEKLLGNMMRAKRHVIFKRHEQEAGEFGEIVYAGMDWVDPALARRSMELMAQEVMPGLS